MTEKQLKQAIKLIIKECLLEVLMEQKLETVVENVISKQSSNVVTENIRNNARFVEEKVQPRPARSQPNNRQALKESLVQKMGVSEDEWKNIYEDVNMDKLPPSGGSSQMENPEFVSEDQLRSLGLL